MSASRVLLTGISGVGKSTVTEDLARQGYQAVDLDSAHYSEWRTISDIPQAAGAPVESERDWVWREERVAELLSEDTDLLFLSGCAANMGPFLPRFDAIVLLSAPKEVIVERLRTRMGNDYGKRTEEAARVLDLKRTVEPLLRRIATHEIDTSAPLDEVVATVLTLKQSAGVSSASPCNL